MKLLEEEKKLKLDSEWLSLVLSAKQMGLTVDDVRAFINEQKNVSTNNNLGASIGNELG